MAKRKLRTLRIIRKSIITGRAIWVSHNRSYNAEWIAYKNVCKQEMYRIRWWGRTLNYRRQNIMRLLNNLTVNLPILGDISANMREAARVISVMANSDPPCDNCFYNHIKEEVRQKRNARRRNKRWQQKYENKD